ncbi:hypothetical protein DF186_25885, partial [Enterococcus hirae]
MRLVQVLADLRFSGSLGPRADLNKEEAGEGGAQKKGSRGAEPRLPHGWSVGVPQAAWVARPAASRACFRSAR